MEPAMVIATSTMDAFFDALLDPVFGILFYALEKAWPFILTIAVVWFFWGIFHKGKA